VITKVNYTDQLQMALGMKVARVTIQTTQRQIAMLVSKPQTTPPTRYQTTQTFASLLRNCKLTQSGDLVGKTVVGRVYHVVDEDLYIDFGHKFGCVCPRPRGQEMKYTRGTEVLLQVKSLEMSQKFLGYEKDLSLLEADCILLGLHNK